MYAALVTPALTGACNPTCNREMISLCMRAKRQRLQQFECVRLWVGVRCAYTHVRLLALLEYTENPAMRCPLYLTKLISCVVAGNMPSISNTPPHGDQQNKPKHINFWGQLPLVSNYYCGSSP